MYVLHVLFLDMNNSFESDLNERCPICQVPLNILKIISVVHISMCDVVWSEMEECANGINCQSESVFHYRDFSHRVLAIHRENLRKRKFENIEEDKSGEAIGSREKSQTENVNREKFTVTQYVEDADNEDNIFVLEPKRVRKINNSAKTERRKKPTSKTTTKDTEKCNNVLVDDALNTTKNRYLHCKVLNTSDLSEKLSVMHEKTNAQIDSECHLSLFYVKKQTIDHNETLKFPKLNIDTSVDGTSLEDEDSSAHNWKDLELKCDENAKKADKCKAEWNNIFGNSKDSKIKNKSNGRNFSDNSINSKKEKVCPYFKKIPGTGFAVDAFQFGSIPSITTYFLSHFHSDHYIGLKKSFSHPIYCSLITANLVKKKLRVHERYLHILELNQSIVINRVEVTCFDANHCPGSLILLFRLINGEQYLHVGDFRASPSMEDEPELQKAHISALYLDTTYFDPRYVFPTQKEVIERVKMIVRDVSNKHKNALFVSGTYLIGKEKVFLAILEELNCKLWAQPPKREVFRCINDEKILSALTENSVEARVHVLPMNYLRFDKLKKHLLDLLGTFTHIFAFKPTGWEMGRASCNDWINKVSEGNITIYGVPYSEHSNFEELCRFIKFIKADKVIPTVTMRNRDMYGYLKKLTNSYKGGSKQQNIEQFMIK